MLLNTVYIPYLYLLRFVFVMFSSDVVSVRLLYCTFHKFINGNNVGVADSDDERDYSGLKATKAFPWYFQFIIMLICLSFPAMHDLLYNDAYGCAETATFLPTRTWKRRGRINELIIPYSTTDVNL